MNCSSLGRERKCSGSQWEVPLLLVYTEIQCTFSSYEMGDISRIVSCMFDTLLDGCGVYWRTCQRKARIKRQILWGLKNKQEPLVASFVYVEWHIIVLSSCSLKIISCSLNSSLKISCSVAWFLWLITTCCSRYQQMMVILGCEYCLGSASSHQTTSNPSIVPSISESLYYK
jgi:hypothetical protein